VSVNSLWLTRCNARQAASSFDQADSTAYDAAPTGKQNIDQFADQAEIPVAPALAYLHDLDQLENSVFGTTYSNHDFDSRLDHLEREVFGKINSGLEKIRLQHLIAQISTGGAFGPLAMLPSSQRETNNTTLAESDATRIVQAIPTHSEAGNYLHSIAQLYPGSYARWQKLPVRVHMPQDCPQAWREELEIAIEQWNRLIPISAVHNETGSDVEIVWVNHLLPRFLGITRVVIAAGQMRVYVFLLRPTFYLEEVSERLLTRVCMHELGHAMGLLGHSTDPRDIMFPIELHAQGKALDLPITASISARDKNTLKELYSSSPLPSSFSLPQPIEWGDSVYETKLRIR
jgi:predicted Zn-dependent protease